jgi:outer membrane protein assembly factor BamD (BamD/ComL family)
MRYALITFAALAAAAALAQAPAPAQVAPPAADPAAELQKIVESVQRDPAAATPETLGRLMALGRQTGKSHVAAAIAKSYLAQRRDVPPALLRQSADAAALAGDLRSAVARYKQYLKAAPTAPDAVDATERLYALLIDCMGAADDAYRLMGEMGPAGRASVTLKRYDTWYVDQARSRRDVPALAARLSAILADAMPLEMERPAYWESLNWLMRELSNARPEHFAALPHCRRITELIRENEAWRARFAFLTANLACQAGAAGKEAAALERDFEPVAAAACSYADAAPRADTVREIIRVFGGGFDRYEDGIYGRSARAKTQVFVHAFGKLSDGEREALFQWTQQWDPNHWAPRMASREGHMQLLQTHAAYFRSSPNVWRMPLVTDGTNAAVYKALAPSARGVASADALIVDALGSSDDLSGCWQRVLQGGWFFSDFGDLSRTMNAVWNTFSRFPRDPSRALPDRANELALARFGADALAKTPIFMFDGELARNYLSATWRYGSADGSHIPAFANVLRSLDWIPYTAQDRAYVFGDVNRDFRGWADQVRNAQRDAQAQVKTATDEQANAQKQRDEAGQKGEANAIRDADGRLNERKKLLETAKAELAKRDAAATVVAPLEEAFRLSMDANQVDPAKAPSDLCRHLARTVVAARAKDAAAFQEAARAAYPLVRDYPVSKTPLGRAIFVYLLKNRLTTFDTLDFQCEVIADQLTRGTPESGNGALSEAVSLCGENRAWWDQAGEKGKRLQYNAVLAKGLRDLLARNQFSETVFEWFKGSRRGRDWTAYEGDLDIVEALVAKPALLGNRSDRAIALMSWIRSDFPKLADKFPLATAFDDLYIEDCRRSRVADKGYYDNGGRDEQGKVIIALAALMGSYDRLPFAGSVATGVYTDRTAFWDVHGRAMGAPPAQRDAMLAQLATYAGKTRFDYYANGGARLRSLTIEGPADRKAFFDQLAAWIAGRRQEPVKNYQASLIPLNGMQAENLAAGELNVLVDLVRLAPEWNWWEMSDLDRLVHDGLVGQRRFNELADLAPRLWGIARSQQNGDQIRNRLVGQAIALSDGGQTDLAATHAMIGLEVLGSALREDQRTALAVIRTKALSGVLALVAVDRADRRFPIFQSQADFQVGKHQEAWQAFLNNRALFGETFRELDTGFSLWLIGSLTDVGDYAGAEATARLMIQWMDQTPQSFDPEERARLLLAYARISFARQEFPRARAICEQVTAAKEFEDTVARRDADLQIAEIDRLTKHYDKAIERLEGMLRQRDAYVQTEANYQLALVKLDQEEYPESRGYVDRVLAIAPSHPNARILEGQLHLRMKKLVEATEVRVGQSTSQQTILPGKPLKVSLEDRNLGIVGQSASIEIRAWTDSGDEERFTLLPFGDSKTKFEGQVPTALAAARPNDKTLQVLGGDTVHYDFSEAFKAANKIAGQELVSIRVISDAELYVSSGKILSREEQEQQRLEQTIRERMAAQARTVGNVALSTVRQQDEIKPGNRINVRVVDPGESRTAGRDKLYVRVATSSGDRVERVVLEETDTHSGIFEGSVGTATASATAFATDSEEGREPNFAITGAVYPPWAALPDNRRPKAFTVDLNNSFALGTLKVVADVPGRQLRRFVLQTSANGEDFQSVAAWPTPLPEWRGQGVLELVRYANANKAPASLRDYQAYFALGYLTDGCSKETVVPTPLAVQYRRNVGGMGDRMGLAQEGANSWYIGHWQLSFYQPVRQKRTFRLASGDSRKEPSNPIILMDGQAGLQPREVTRSVGKGMHRIDAYFAASRRNELETWLETDVAGQAGLVKASAETFALPADLPPPALQAAIAAIAEPRAAVTNMAGGTVFEARFPTNLVARTLRLWLLDFEADAPAIRKLHLTAGDGRQILPTAHDVVKLKENDLLEIVPGDRVTVTYEDPHFLNKERQFSEAFMRATFRNATLSACFIESDVDADGNRKPRYIPMRRFKPGHVVNVFVEDADCDTSDQPDVIKLRVRVSGGRQIEIDGLETEPHSGVFLGKAFPVSGAPQRPSEITLAPNEDLTVAYWDAENTDPGIAWERTVTLEQTVPGVPELRLYDYASRLLSAQEREASAPVGVKGMDEQVPVTRSIRATRPEATTNAAATVLLGCPLIVDVTHPEIAQSPMSHAVLYVQTSSGRGRQGGPAQAPFDIQVPGTVRVEVPPSDRPTVPPPPGYRDVAVAGAASESSALDDGRFTFVVPLQLRPVPGRSLALAKPGAAGADDDDWTAVSVGVSTVDASGRPQMRSESIRVPILAVRGGDTLFVGYPYTDAAGSNRWITASATLGGDAFLDVMERRYQEPVTNLHIGESAYIRVINPTLDRSDDKDATTVELTTSSGQRQRLTLTETLAHSGVFKGASQLVYSRDAANSNASGVVRADYGDTVELAYAPADGAKLTRTVAVFKGDDGVVQPFTKRFKDPEIAVQTQFTVAEAYFEMAKRHRELGQEELARREIGQGKKLLEEAIRDYPTTSARAQADYLLADLALESAAQTEDAERKARLYLEAVGRFTDIVASYADSPYAPKAQFKKALTYEKMGKIDEACEEYVKLSYRYPDNELVAETIARLGQYFLTKGKALQDRQAAEADVVVRERVKIESAEMYTTAAQVFGRLALRFPDHRLAGKATVLSGQCYMRAEQYGRAIEAFTRVIEAKQAAPDLVAEAMYWCGDSHIKVQAPESMVSAYRIFKKLTWDYPESVWAKYARGRLSEEAMSRIDAEAAQ